MSSSMSRLLLASLRRSTTRQSVSSSYFLFQLIPSLLEQRNNQRSSNVLPCYAFSSSYPPFHRRSFTSGSPKEEREKIFSDTEEILSPVLDEWEVEGSPGEDSFLPIRVIISLIDGLQSSTGLPWWVVIASSSLVMRLAMFPFIVFQQKKARTIMQILRQLPSPIPPPFSGKSKRDQLSLFLRKKSASRCPSFLWLVAPWFVQFPVFVFMVMSIRKMCLDFHPGFDCGGILWFRNLTYFSSDAYGLIFPITIASLYYTIIQVSYDKNYLQSVKGFFSVVLKCYKLYLDLVTIPIFFGAIFVPQGSQVYWITNSSLTIIQSLLLKNKTVRMKLGLMVEVPKIETNLGSADETPANSQEQSIKISAKNLSPKQLYNLALQIMPTGNRQAAISLLQQAIEKDPNHAKAMILMGQALLEEGYPAPSVRLLEKAASMILANEPGNTRHLILAYTWAGVAHRKQGNKSEGIEQLRKAAGFAEPDDSGTKLFYLDGLVMLAAALHDDGYLDEAAKFLNLAAERNSEYRNLFEKCIESDTDLVGALVRSRRRDY